MKGYTQQDLENDRKEFGYPRVVTAYAEFARGPGFANSPLWVVMEDLDPESKTGKRMYLDCIQPEDQSNIVHTMYVVSEHAHLVMRAEAEKVMAERIKRLRIATRKAEQRGKT
jgi:hypothetical protein